jgi:hypothetical protein
LLAIRAIAALAGRRRRGCPQLPEFLFRQSADAELLEMAAAWADLVFPAERAIALENAGMATAAPPSASAWRS